MKKYYFQIRLQNGDLIVDSRSYCAGFSSEKQAEEECDKFLDDYISGQDCDDEAFTPGDFRTYIKPYPML